MQLFAGKSTRIAILHRISQVKIENVNSVNSTFRSQNIELRSKNVQAFLISRCSIVNNDSLLLYYCIVEISFIFSIGYQL